MCERVKCGQIWLDEHTNDQFMIKEILEHQNMVVGNDGSRIDIDELKTMDDFVLLEDVRR